MSNKTKKMNKAVKEAEVVEEEVVETAEVVDAVVENNDETEVTDVAEVKTETDSSEAEVVVETKKVFKPFAKAKEVNWKKVGADALKVTVGLVAGFGIAKALSGGEEPSEVTEDPIDAEFTEIEQNDVETQEEI